MKKLLSRKYIGFILAGVAIVAVAAVALQPIVGWQVITAYGIYTAGNVTSKIASKK